MAKPQTSKRRTKNWTRLNTEDFKKLAETRLNEAQILLDNRKYDGAFYLAGYAVECGLKACIASRTRQGDFPPEWNVVRESFYTHSLETLCDTVFEAGVFEDTKRRDSRPEDQWTVVKEWTEKSRYEIHSEEKAGDMITSSRGVIAWLRTFW